MTALLALEPRAAGTEVIEPDVRFAETEDTLHGTARCPGTILCHDHTNICYITE